MGGEERRLLPSRFEKHYAACPGPCPGSRWPAGARPERGSRTSAARLRTGGEEESPRTGDSNPGCNCLVRGYSPSMHFFWGGDMPHYSPPLPFRRGRALCPCMLASPRGARLRGRGLARCVACPGLPPGRAFPAWQSGVAVRAGQPAGAPGSGVVDVRAGCDSPAFLASLCSPFSRVFQFLDRYISLA